MPLIDDKVAQFGDDADLAHAWMNGGETTVVETEGGPVRSPAKMIADNQAMIDLYMEQMASLSAPEAAAGVGTADGGTVQQALDARLELLTPGTEYLRTGVAVLAPKTLAAGQSIRGDGASQTILNVPAEAVGITLENSARAERLRLVGGGKIGPATVGFYSEGWGGALSQVEARDCGGAGFRFKGGWGIGFYQFRAYRCNVGMEFIEHPILPGWAGSGHVIGPGYITDCNLGLDVGKLWNPTIMNLVIDYCVTPAKFSGTHQVIINPWFENNTNPPSWTRGAVLMGGRGVTFPSTLDADLPGTSAGTAQEEAITWLDEQGISVFRDTAQRMFYVTGRKGVQALRHFGVEGLTELAVQGRHFMPTAAQADFSSVRGYGATAGSAVTPADQYSANHETSAVVNRGYRSVSTVRGSVVFRTGVKGAAPGDSTSTDRWQVNYQGHILPFADNAYDIGSSAARVKAVYTSALSLSPGAAPASATAAGVTGEVRTTADYIYVCVATNTWKRSALTTW